MVKQKVWGKFETRLLVAIGTISLVCVKTLKTENLLFSTMRLLTARLPPRTSSEFCYPFCHNKAQIFSEFALTKIVSIRQGLVQHQNTKSSLMDLLC